MKVRVCAVADLPFGEVSRMELPGGPALALYRLDDGVFATDDLCTHGAARLSDGEVEDGRIVCPYHLGAFDIRTGEATDAPCQLAVRTYAIQVVDGEVTHTSLPEQTNGATLCLMQVPGTSPWVAILTKDGSLSVPAEMAGGELPDALRRLSRTAITSE